VEELNRSVIETKRAQDCALEQLSVFLEEVNRQYDPFQRLPVELVTSIFLYLPRPASLDVFDVTNTAKKHHALRPVPFLLGSVCRYWRRIVWSTPQFWNILWLDVRVCGPMGRSRILSEWLERSRQLPLYVCMFLPTGIANEHRLPSLVKDELTAWKATDEMIDTLNHYIPRLKVLHLSLPGPQIERFGRELIPGLATAKTDDSNTILERLFIDVELRQQIPWDDDPWKNYKFELDGRMASPTHLSFGEIDFWDIRIHWENVIYLEATQISLRSAFKLLQLAPQMQQNEIITKSTILIQSTLFIIRSQHLFVTSIRRASCPS